MLTPTANVFEFFVSSLCVLCVKAWFVITKATKQKDTKFTKKKLI